MKRSFVKSLVLSIVVSVIVVGSVHADETFTRMIRAENWAEAIKYADDKIPPANRDAAVWANVGLAHENTGAPERALACYLVGMNIDGKNYDVHLGAARVYNKMKSHDQALEMAKKAMDLRMTGDASWEYAAACIATGKTADAKKALEKVVETDASNVVANRELGNIYYRDKDYAKALPLLKRSMGRQADSDVALRIAEAHRELGQLDSAIAYYNRAASDKSKPRPEVFIELGRLHFNNKNYREAASNFEKANRNALTGDDLFNWAFSLEENKADAKAITDAYAAAMSKYGNSTAGNALVAREKVGRAAIARKAWRDADNALAPVLRADPNAGKVKDIYILMAQITEGQGNTNATIGHLENAIKRDRNNVEAYARLADLYTKTKQTEKAKSTMERLVSLDPNNPKIHLSLGEYHLSAKKNQDALTSFQRAFTLEASAEAAVGMMNAAWALKRLDLARDAAESALHRDPGLKEPQLMLAKIYMQEKNYRAARGVLLPLLKTEQDNLSLWMDLAEVCEKTGDQGGLADADKKIVALDPKNVPSRMRIAKAAERAGDLKTAYDMLKELTKLRPRDADIHRSMYEIAVKQKNNTAAIAHLKDFLALKPNDAEAHRDLGNLQFEAKDNNGALESYRAAVKADPKITGLYKNYATILMMQKAPAAELMPILVAAVTADEADEAIYTAAGKEYQKQSNWAKAIEMYQKALAANSKNVDNLAALAECQRRAGNVADAILSYEQVTALNPKANKEFKALGDLYNQQKRMPQAVAAYKKYLEKTPTDVAVARIVGDFEFENKKWAEANKYYAMVSGPEASKPAFLRNFGTSCFEAKNFARAGMLFKQLTDANPKDTAALRRLFEIEMQNKNTSGAIAALRRYVEVAPSDADAQKALGDMLYDAKDQQGALAAYKAALAADSKIKGVHKRHVELVLRHGAAAEQIAALNAAIAANEADAAMFAKLGELYRAANNCKAALPALERAAQMDPRNSSVQGQIADCHVKSGNIAAAVVALEMVTAQNPNATNEFKQLGDLYVQQKKMPQAVAAYRKFLEKGTDNNAARLVGEAAFREKKWGDAVRFLGMVKGQEKNVQFMEMYGQAAFENKDNARAVDIYKQLAVLAPQNADYVKMQYDLAVRMGARDDAATHLRRFLTLRPNDAPMQKTLGDMLFDRRDRPGALAAYRAALRADPAMKGIHRRVVELVEGTNGTPAERVAAMEAALAANEADPPMLVKLGNMYVEQKQPAKAVPLFDKAVAANPRDVQLLLALAQSQQAAGQIDQAIITYEKYVMMDSKAIAQYKTLGDLYTRQKKPAEAMRSYRRFLERNPTDHAVALMVAREAYNAKQWADAVRFFAMVQGAEAKKPEFLKMYGTAAYEAKDNPRAMTVLQELVKLTPKDADVLKMLEEVCTRTGSRELAVTYLRQYCELRPQDIQAQRRLGDLLFDRKDEAGALAAYRAVMRADANAVKGIHKRIVGMVMKSGSDADKMAALSAAIAAGEGDTQMFAALGGLHKKRNEFAKAAEMFERASKADPRNASYLTELADCQLKAGNVNAAATTLQQAIMLNPRAVDEYKVLGDIQMQQKRTDQAMDSYRRFLDGTKTPDPKIAQLVGDNAFDKKQWAQAFKYLSMVKDNNTAEYLYRLGVSAQEAGNSKAAVDALERYRVASRPAAGVRNAQPHANRVDGLRMLLAAYEKEKNSAKAAEIIDDILKGPPAVKDADLAYRRALMVEAQNAERAIPIFEANTRDYPRDHRNFLKVGIHNARRGGNAQKALQMFEATVKIADTVSRAWFELGLLYGNSNRNRDMMRSFEKFISLETRNADAILRVGEYLLVNKKMAAESMMFLEMANALKPNDPKIQPLLASGYMQTGRIDEGVKILEQVVRRTRGAQVPIETRIVLGDAYLMMGRNMEAATEWKMVTDQERKPEYLTKYATALIAINNTSQAMNIANEILRQQPENVEALMLSGRVKVAQRNYEDAMETFKKVGYINANHAGALYERGNILFLQQNFDLAKAFFERALKADAKYALAELGLAKVARAQRNQQEYQRRLDRARTLEPNNKEIQDELRRAASGR